jgi:AraC family transcriptional regulator, regulatory protein of adaptative response / methylated-DNA-[protein]-cysteine methyltransferase
VTTPILTIEADQESRGQTPIEAHSTLHPPGIVSDYPQIQRAIEFIEANTNRQPSLAQVAEHVGLSEFHFQRLFTRWAGISPKRFLQFLTLEHAKRLLRDSRTVLDASYEAGLSGSGRLHDLFVTVESVTPGEFRALGAGLEIAWGVHPTPFGDSLIATTPRGICALYFVREGGLGAAMEELAATWPEASLVERPSATAPYAEQIFAQDRSANTTPLPVHLRGTNFQVNVWKALLRIPCGTAVSYEDLADMISAPRAARAVGSAVGSNPVSFLIPCHRVIRKTGHFGNYGGGPSRKRAILAWESALVLGEEDAQARRAPDVNLMPV